MGDIVKAFIKVLKIVGLSIAVLFSSLFLSMIIVGDNSDLGGKLMFIFIAVWIVGIVIYNKKKTKANDQPVEMGEPDPSLDVLPEYWSSSTTTQNEPVNSYNAVQAVQTVPNVSQANAATSVPINVGNRGGLVALKCPSCGADITLDNSRDFGFCQFCGTKVMQDKVVVEHRGSISVDRSAEINNLLIRAQEMQSRGADKEAEHYFNRILEIDANNAVAKAAMERYYRVINEPNLLLAVTVGKMYNKNVNVYISIDGVKRGTISVAYPNAYTLSAGRHTVVARIAQTFSKVEFEVDIKDRYTKVNRVINCSLGNRIDVY